MDARTFAKWTEERDIKVGVLDGPASVRERLAYLEEANFYLGRGRGEWPCGILLRMGGTEHAYHHKGCPTTDPLE